MQEAGMQLRTKQRIRLFLKSVLLLFTAMILAGIAYEQIGERQDRKRFSANWTIGRYWRGVRSTFIVRAKVVPP